MMERKNMYVVMKHTDIDSALSDSDKLLLSAILSKVERYRKENGKDELVAVVVEKDWHTNQRGKQSKPASNEKKINKNLLLCLVIMGSCSDTSMLLRLGMDVFCSRVMRTIEVGCVHMVAINSAYSVAMTPNSNMVKSLLLTWQLILYTQRVYRKKKFFLVTMQTVRL